MSFEEKTCGAGLVKLRIIMVYYSLSSIYWFSWGEPSNQWPLPAARAAPTWAFLGLDSSRPSFWNRLLRSLQEVHSLHLGLSKGCFSTWSVLTFNIFQLRFHRILMDFEGLYAWAQDLPTDTEMDWATDSQHHLETWRYPTPSGTSGTRWTQPWAKDQWTPHLCHMPYRCCCNDEN